MRQLAAGLTSIAFLTALAVGPVDGRGADARERPAPTYTVEPDLVDAQPGAARALLGWPTLRGTCRIERAVRPIELTYG